MGLGARNPKSSSAISIGMPVIAPSNSSNKYSCLSTNSHAAARGPR